MVEPLGAAKNHVSGIQISLAMYMDCGMSTVSRSSLPSAVFRVSVVSRLSRTPVESQESESMAIRFPACPMTLIAPESHSSFLWPSKIKRVINFTGLGGGSRWYCTRHWSVVGHLAIKLMEILALVLLYYPFVLDLSEL
ncbi:hypothetical protein PoB_004271300 [Plakobranchus ocellatus]|uniref:Uncharacterized protein n=1 Tax=Plakobranchus ocellatus TaxID=259542 RepID=A0AAV4B9E7_9GAST|nr:hypothetical protein PoB_004271300 [Plakobranchus ocellatus]